MNIKTHMGWASFLVALSAFNLPVDAAIAPPSSQAITTESSQSSIETRLTRISATLKSKENQFPKKLEKSMNGNLALGWLNGRGGSFLNRRPWRNGWGNGWRDGGGFFNAPAWGNGGFFNAPSWGNGGFFNRY